MEIIKVSNVVKKFGDYAASNDITFNVNKGSVFGLLGPNGAGKTTLIRMITSIIIPDEGTISLFGESQNQNQQNRIGYLPEERGLYKKLKVIDQISYFGQLKGLSKLDAVNYGRYWLGKMDAKDWENKKIEELSKGMQQKIQFICTILHKPELLILDEPFSGFDPINTELLKNIILDLKAEGCTIILSTHIMEQAEQLCDDICLINKGKIILSGKIRDIKSKFGNDTVIIEFDGSDSFIDQLTNLKVLNRTHNRFEFRFDNTITNPNDILASAMKNSQIIKYELVEPSLHEIFIETVSNQGGING